MQPVAKEILFEGNINTKFKGSNLFAEEGQWE